jgi:hypothetical protein
MKSRAAGAAGAGNGASGFKILPPSCSTSRIAVAHCDGAATHRRCNRGSIDDRRGFAMNAYPPLRWYAFAAFLAATASTSAALDQANAMSKEQAREQCRAQFVPVVQDCVRRKAAASGGSPTQYIAGCRAAILPQARECVAKLMGVGAPPADAGGTDTGATGPAAAPTGAAEPDVAAITLPPPSGRGRVVLVLSGIDGPFPFTDYAQKIASLGYYTVLLDGRQILSDDMQGGARLQKVIAKAQSAPNALPGKVAVIGFAVGGGGALEYAESQPDTVATVIAYYPVTAFIAKAGGMKTFVGNFQVPLLVFAAAKDSFQNCCLLATAKDMDAAAKALGKPMQLVVYPAADHDFAAGPNVRAGDAADAWQRTSDALHQYLNDQAAH